MKKRKKICILGSTGSIGTQALQVIEEHPDLYEAYVLTANRRADMLIEKRRNISRQLLSLPTKVNTNRCVTPWNMTPYRYIQEVMLCAKWYRWTP